MPALDALPPETLGEEEELKLRPIIPMLYVVPRPKKMSSVEKKRMPCQEVFKHFITQEKIAPSDLGVKDEESRVRENVEVPVEPSKLQVTVTTVGLLWSVIKQPLIKSA